MAHRTNHRVRAESATAESSTHRGPSPPASGREVEQRRARGEIACAECRRLKLKCTRTVPCESCVRRGCGALCPNGSLTTGETTRSVDLASKALNKQITAAGARMRELEKALAELQAKHSSQPHPLLRDSDELDSPLQQASPSKDTAPDPADPHGMIAVEADGSQHFYGYAAGFESLLVAASEKLSDLRLNSPPLYQGYGAYPACPGSQTLDQFHKQLPHWDRAVYLCDLHLKDYAYMTTALTAEQLKDEMLPIIYRRIPPDPTFDYFSPHSLALLFMVFATGAHMDTSLPAYAEEAMEYHRISRQALALQRIYDRPSILTIQCLHLIYLFLASYDGDYIEEARSFIFQAARVSYVVGLHYEPNHYGLSQAMIKRRRILFWNVFMNEAWSSVTTGRPPVINLSYVNCRRPDGLVAQAKEAYIPESLGYSSLLSVTVKMLPQFARITLPSQTTTISVVAELDRVIQQNPLPVLKPNETEESVGRRHSGMNPSDSMIIYTLFIMPYVLKLYAHRTFFVKALLASPHNPLDDDEHASSFDITYGAARLLARQLTAQFERTPRLLVYPWYMWTNAMSAGMVLGLTAMYAPRWPSATTALHELEQLINTFTRGAELGGRARPALKILQRLYGKAQISFRSGTPPVRPSPGDKTVEDDELAIFSGETRVRRAAPSDASSSHGAPSMTPVMEAPPPRAFPDAYPLTMYAVTHQSVQQHQPVAQLSQEQLQAWNAEAHYAQQPPENLWGHAPTQQWQGAPQYAYAVQEGQIPQLHYDPGQGSYKPHDRADVQHGMMYEGTHAPRQ